MHLHATVASVATSMAVSVKQVQQVTLLAGCLMLYIQIRLMSSWMILVKVEFKVEQSRAKRVKALETLPGPVEMVMAFSVLALRVHWVFTLVK